VLERGRLVQAGPHRELMEQEGLYRRAIHLQGLDTESLRLLQRTRFPWGPGAFAAPVKDSAIPPADEEPLPPAPGGAS
jgi:hypothetical protein